MTLSLTRDDQWLVRSVARKLGDFAVINSGTDPDNGFWWADAANAVECIGVYGLDSESEALNALVGAVRSRKRKAKP